MEKRNMPTAPDTGNAEAQELNGLKVETFRDVIRSIVAVDTYIPVADRVRRAVRDFRTGLQQEHALKGQKMTYELKLVIQAHGQAHHSKTPVSPTDRMAVAMQIDRKLRALLERRGWLYLTGALALVLFILMYLGDTILLAFAFAKDSLDPVTGALTVTWVHMLLGGVVALVVLLLVHRLFLFVPEKYRDWVYALAGIFAALGMMSQAAVLGEHYDYLMNGVSRGFGQQSTSTGPSLTWADPARYYILGLAFLVASWMGSIVWRRLGDLSNMRVIQRHADQTRRGITLLHELEQDGRLLEVKVNDFAAALNREVIKGLNDQGQAINQATLHWAKTGEVTVSQEVAYVEIAFAADDENEGPLFDLSLYLPAVEQLALQLQHLDHTPENARIVSKESHQLLRKLNISNVTNTYHQAAQAA